MGMLTRHDLDEMDRTYRDLFDFELRELIGKTEDREVPLCQHSFTVAMEMAEKGVIVCRVCGTSLNGHQPRYNDHKILRNPLCVQPICLKCADENPDVFHRNFKKGVERMDVARDLGMSPLYLDSARFIVDFENTRRGTKVL